MSVNMFEGLNILVLFRGLGVSSELNVWGLFRGLSLSIRADIIHSDEDLGSRTSSYSPSM